MSRRNNRVSRSGRAGQAGASPDKNLGVPDEPLLMRMLSSIELVVSVVLFLGIVVGVMHQVIGRGMYGLNRLSRHTPLVWHQWRALGTPGCLVTSGSPTKVM